MIPQMRVSWGVVEETLNPGVSLKEKLSPAEASVKANWHWMSQRRNDVRDSGGIQSSRPEHEASCAGTSKRREKGSSGQIAGGEKVVCCGY